MRNVKVYHSNTNGGLRYAGQFPWLESEGLEAAAWWAYRHGYGSGLSVEWA